MKIAMPLKVWNIGTSKHKIDKYILEPFYLPAKSNNNKQIMACICQKLYIIDNLKANLLIKNNIISIEDIKIDIGNKKAYMFGCKATISIIARQKSWFIRRMFYSATHIIIPLQSQVFALTNNFSLLENWNFFLSRSSNQNSYCFCTYWAMI